MRLGDAIREALRVETCCGEGASGSPCVRLPVALRLMMQGSTYRARPVCADHVFDEMVPLWQILAALGKGGQT